MALDLALADQSLDALDPSGALAATGLRVRADPATIDAFFATLADTPLAAVEDAATNAPAAEPLRAAGAPASSTSEAGTDASATPMSTPVAADAGDSDAALAALIAEEALDAAPSGSLEIALPPSPQVDLGVDTDLNFDDLFDDAGDLGSSPLSGRASSPSFLRPMPAKRPPVELTEEELAVLDELDIVIED